MVELLLEKTRVQASPRNLISCDQNHPIAAVKLEWIGIFAGVASLWYFEATFPVSLYIYMDSEVMLEEELR